MDAKRKEHRCSWLLSVAFVCDLKWIRAARSTYFESEYNLCYASQNPTLCVLDVLKACERFKNWFDIKKCYIWASSSLRTLNGEVIVTALLYFLQTRVLRRSKWVNIFWQQFIRALQMRLQCGNKLEPLLIPLVYPHCGRPANESSKESRCYSIRDMTWLLVEKIKVPCVNSKSL